jgi:DNA repair exonuclease SbcCD ATPase subunit
MKKYLFTLLTSGFLLCNFLLAQPLPQVKETLKALKDGEITAKEAKQKISEIRKEMAGKGELKRPERPEKGELSDDVKSQLDSIKEKQEALHSQLKDSLAELGEDATKEEIKAAAKEFKEANKEKFEAIKAEHEAIREDLKAARPDRPERPQIELSEELKGKVADLKEKREELHQAQKEMLSTLKDASKEERKVIIEQFKEDNKAKHKEIKETAKALKEEVREQVETEATRTSDL